MCAKNNQSASPLGKEFIRECPLCQETYDIDRIHVLQQEAGAHVVHLTCPVCAHAMLACVLINQVGMSSIGMMTDLTSEDVVRLYQKRPVTDTELLVFHEWLHAKPHVTSTLLQMIEHTSRT